MVPGYCYSEATRKKMSEKKQGVFDGEKNPMYGRHHSDETRKKISEKTKGRPSKMKGKHLNLSPEQRKHASEVRKGKGHPVTEETKKKLSDAKKGIPKSEEAKRHLSESKREKGKRVLCVELNQVFRSITDACEALGVDPSVVVRVCKGKNKTAGGYHWRYATEQERKELKQNDSTSSSREIGNKN